MINKNQQKWFSRLAVYSAILLFWLFLIFWLTGGNLSEFQDWVNNWNRWDGHWYEKIWLQGYPRTDPRSLVFPPAYSLIIGYFSQIASIPFGTAALCINILSYAGAMMMAAELLNHHLAVPRWPFFALSLTSPSAYFVFAPYSDSLFALVLWGALTAGLAGKASQPNLRRFSIYSIIEFFLVLLAPWIRLTGFAFLSWILLKRWSGLASLISLAGWLGFNMAITGNPFYFLDAQQLFLMPPGNIVDGIVATFSSLIPVQLPFFHENGISYLQSNFLPALYFLGLGGIGIWLCIRNHWLIGVTVLAILLISHNQAFWRSTVRYDLPLIPLLFVPFLILSSRASYKVWIWYLVGIVGSLQFILQIYFAQLFRSGLWAF